MTRSIAAKLNRSVSEADVTALLFIVFTLSKKIRSGGRKKKSTKIAKASVIAVSRAISLFTAKPDCPRTIKPITRPSEVTVNAMPTERKAWRTLSSALSPRLRALAYFNIKCTVSSTTIPRVIATTIDTASVTLPTE